MARLTFEVVCNDMDVLCHPLGVATIHVVDKDRVVQLRHPLFPNSRVEVHQDVVFGEAFDGAGGVRRPI